MGMDLIVKQAWQSTGSSGALAAIELPISAAYSAMYVDHSTVGTTQSVSYQSAQSSAGPWVIEGSTQIATGNISTAFVMRVTGPVGPWVRPYLHTTSTGLYNILLLGVG